MESNDLAGNLELALPQPGDILEMHRLPAKGDVAPLVLGRRFADDSETGR